MLQRQSGEGSHSSEFDGENANQKKLLFEVFLFKCGVGEGDCDGDETCAEGLICGSSNCDLTKPRFDDGDDCCIEPTSTTSTTTTSAATTTTTTTTTATATTTSTAAATTTTTTTIEQFLLGHDSYCSEELILGRKVKPEISIFISLNVISNFSAVGWKGTVTLMKSARMDLYVFQTAVIMAIQTLTQEMIAVRFRQSLDLAFRRVFAPLTWIVQV